MQCVLQGLNQLRGFTCSKYLLPYQKAASTPILIDSAAQRNDSCESHVSVYYEQDQKKEPCTGPPPNLPNCNDKTVYENPAVEINDEDTTSIDLPPLIWHGYENSPKLLTVTNTGRTILINGHWMNLRPYIQGGPLNGTYLFSQIHFHCPSEHEINGKRYPLEMHIVHYKTSYLTQEKAMKEKDGTVVLVYLFQLTDTSETVVSQITKLGCELKEVNSRTESTEIALNKLVRPFFSNYYIYWGSLTTRRNKYLLQWIINCNLLAVTKAEVQDLSNIITSAIGLTIKPTPQLKPEFDDIYHVGEADYSLPPLKCSSTGDICIICKHYETIPYVSCSCKLEEVDCGDDGTPKSQLVCECKSKTQVREYNCRKLDDKYICCKCRSADVSPCLKCYDGGKGILIGTICPKEGKGKKEPKLFCDLEANGPDGEIVLKCKNKNLVKECNKNMKKKQKKAKQKKGRKQKKSSDQESVKSSSKSSMSENKSKETLDSGAESCESEVDKKKSKKGKKVKVTENKSKDTPDSGAESGDSVVDKKKSKKGEKDKIHFKEEVESSESIEEITVKKKKKKKQEVEVHHSLVALDTDQSKPSLNTITFLSQMEPSSSGLNAFGPKSSAHDGMEKENKKLSSPKPSVNHIEGAEEEENKKLDSPKSSAKDVHEAEEEKKKLCSPKPSANDVHDTEEEKKTDNAETHEVKITQTCEIIEEPLSKALEKESKSTIVKEKKRVDSLKDGILKSALGSRSSKSRSRSRVNEQKTKESESPEKKNLAVGISKSKSHIGEVFSKTKASLKKESERSDSPDTSDASKSKTGRSKTVSEPAKSAQEVKCSVKKSIPAIENLKSDSTPLNDSKSRSVKLRKKSTEEAKGKNKADNEEQKSKQEYDITTIFEKKQEGKKAQSLAGDSKDVKVNFLLSPDANIKSDPSCAIAPSESDLTAEKKPCEKVKSRFSQDFTVNTATIAGSEFPTNELKEHPQGCLLMEHTFHTQDKEKTGECSSQEYHVAIIYDQQLLQEYRGNFHPQELQLGDCEQLKLVPRYPEPENLNFRLQDCFIKKQSLDQICVRVKFLLKDMGALNVSENKENRLNGTSEKKEKFLLDKQTQCNFKQLNLVRSSILKSINQNKNKEKTLGSKSGEILMDKDKVANEEKEKQKLKNEEVQKQQLGSQKKEKRLSKQKSIHWENETAEPEKSANILQNDSDVQTQDAFISTDTEQFSTDSSLKENRPETERNEKKMKSLYVKRRKTVYFIYDKVEKDENTGKKVFVGSFRTKEELDSLNKPQVFQENEATEKLEETCEGKGFPPLENKKADSKVTKPETSLAQKSSSYGKNFPSTSQDTSNRNKDLVTLHKYKPKYPEANRFKRELKNLLPIKVTDNSQRNVESSKIPTNVFKPKAPKTDIQDLRQAPESEPQRENPDPDGGKIEKKTKANIVVPNKNRENYSQTEVTVPENSGKAKDDSATDNPQKSLDKKESQAALILIPVEAESFSKSEVILIEQLDKSKKDNKKDKNTP